MRLPLRDGSIFKLQFQFQLQCQYPRTRAMCIVTDIDTVTDIEFDIITVTAPSSPYIASVHT